MTNGEPTNIHDPSPGPPLVVGSADSWLLPALVRLSDGSPTEMVRRPRWFADRDGSLTEMVRWPRWFVSRDGSSAGMVRQPRWFDRRDGSSTEMVRRLLGSSTRWLLVPLVPLLVGSSSGTGSPGPPLADMPTRSGGFRTRRTPHRQGG